MLPPECRSGELIEREIRVAPIEPVKSGYALGQQVIEVYRRATNKATGQQSEGHRYYITSLSEQQSSPEQLAKHIRQHWSVEIHIHWLKDAVMGEDRTRQRNSNAAQALGLLRTALLAPVRKAGHTSLTKAMEDCAKDSNRALRIILRQHLA